jgi:hypothetical protein
MSSAPAPAIFTSSPDAPGLYVGKLWTHAACMWVFCQQGWDVLLQRVAECKAALQAPDLPSRGQDLAPATMLPPPCPMDAQSGLLIVEITATTDTGVQHPLLTAAM